MKKRKLLIISSAVIIAGAVSSCGNGLKAISADDAKAAARVFDQRLSDLVMKDSTVNLHVNKFDLTNVNGAVAYSKKDDLQGNVTGVKVSNASFTVANQDVADVTVPNSLLNDVNSVAKQIPEGEETFLNASYALSATISEELINNLVGTLDQIGHVTEWKHLKTQFYSKTGSKGNPVLSFDVTIDNLNQLYEEMSAAKMPNLGMFFKFVGNGSLNAKITCDDYGYISEFALKVSGEDINYSKNAKKIPENLDGSLPGITDIAKGNVKFKGVSLTGKGEIDISASIKHDEAKEYGVSFQKTTVVADEKSATGYKEDKITQIEDLGSNAKSTTGSDDVLDFSDYSPLKQDPVRSLNIYGPRNIAYEDMGYAIKFKIKDDLLKDGKYSYLTGKDEEMELKQALDYLLENYGVDQDGYPVNEVSYPYGKVSINGIQINNKVKTADLLTSDYCYFTFEEVQEVKVSPEVYPYICLHIGKDVIRKASKLTSNEMKILVNIDVWDNQAK